MMRYEESVHSNLIDYYDQYRAQEEMEAQFYFGVMSFKDSCDTEGFYVSLCVLDSLCSDSDRVLLRKAMQKFLENTK